MQITDPLRVKVRPMPGAAPYLTMRRFPLAIVLAVVVCWPLLATGNVFIFADTASYFKGGAAIWQTFFEILGLASGGDPSGLTGAGSGDGDGAPTALMVNERGTPVTGRSFLYSSFVYVFNAVAGLWSIAFAQALTMVLMSLALVTREALASPYILVIGAVLLATCTTLPWYSAYLIPDIFGAGVILFGVILIRDFDDLSFSQKAVVTLLAAFSASAHYGNMPLVFAVVGVVLGLRLLMRRLSLSAVIAGAVAVGFSPMANLTASTAVLDNASVTPMRLPYLLNRSLNDGPALWYLQEVCPEADLALCIAFGDNIKADTGWFFWSDEGLKSLSPELMERVRDEELKVVIAAFRRYPLQQSASFLSNGAQQILRFGTEGIVPVSDLNERYEAVRDGSEAFGRSLVTSFSPITVFAAWAGAATLLLLVILRRTTRRQKEMLAVLMLTLVANSFIFGGLSYPIERYQGRVIWIVPLLAILFVAEVMSRRPQSGKRG